MIHGMMHQYTNSEKNAGIDMYICTSYIFAVSGFFELVPREKRLNIHLLESATYVFVLLRVRLYQEFLFFAVGSGFCERVALFFWPICGTDGTSL